MTFCTHFRYALLYFQASPSGSAVKHLPASKRHRRCGFDPWVKKIPWRRAWTPTPVLLPEESHGQRSLAGYSPWGHKETQLKRLSTHTCTSCCLDIFLFYEVKSVRLVSIPYTHVHTDTHIYTDTQRLRCRYKTTLLFQHLGENIQEKEKKIS